jgi:hypothetical protein
MSEKPMRPFVQIATICQAPLLEANTQSLSLIRITDRVPVQGVTDEMRPQPLQQFALVVILKSGEMKGKYHLKIIPETPSGKRLQPFVNTVLFEGDERGVAIVMPVPLVAEEEGLYWFDVLIEDDLLTRIPLRVMYQKIQAIPPGMMFPGQPTG